MANDKKPSKDKASTEDLLNAIRALKGEMPRPGGFSGEPDEEASRLRQSSSDPKQSVFEAGPRGKTERGFNPSVPPEARYPLTEQAAALPAFSYEYRPQQAAESGKFGRYVGPMAQDMERLPAMRDNVQIGPDGLRRVDTGQQTMTNTATISEMARRQKAMEGGYQDLIDAIRSLKGDMPRPESRPFDQPTGEIVRENPYMPKHAEEALSNFKKRGGVEQNLSPMSDADLVRIKKAIAGNALQEHEERQLRQMTMSDVNGKLVY